MDFFLGTHVRLHLKAQGLDVLVDVTGVEQFDDPGTCRVI